LGKERVNLGKMSEKSVKYDPSKKPTKKQPSTPLLRKVWYAVTAILFFILVLVALISASYILFFLNQNPGCSTTANSSTKVRNSAIATVTVAVICLVLVIGFAALQVRNQRKGKRKEKEEAAANEEDDEDEEEEEEVKPKKKGKKKIKKEEEEERENILLTSSSVPPTIQPNTVLDPKEMQQILQELTVPHLP